MDVVNRSAIVIKPKEPYLDWANEVAQTMESMDELRQQSTVILIPKSAYQDHAEIFLRENCVRIFERELDAWSPARELRPANPDYETLTAWFDIEVHALVLDLSEDSLHKETDF